MDWKRFFIELSKILVWPVVVIVIVLLAFLARITNWKPITDLINVLVWPVVVVVVLLAFYKPLAVFITGLSGRVMELRMLGNWQWQRWPQELGPAGRSGKAPKNSCLLPSFLRDLVKRSCVLHFASWTRHQIGGVLFVFCPQLKIPFFDAFCPQGVA